MIKLNIHQAKTHLSRYLEEVKAGKTIILCKHNVPIAEIRPIEQLPTKKRPIGLDAAAISITDEFFEELPESLLDAFEGKA